MQRLTRNNIFANTMYLKEEKFRGSRDENELTDRNFISLTNDFVIVV